MKIEEMMLWFEIHQLQQQYVAALDNDRLEEWCSYFTADCLYEIVPKENEDMGLPIGLIHCDSQAMLRDRVVSLRHANIFGAHSYRHMTSGLTLKRIDEDSVECESSYVVVQTLQHGESSVYQAGRYLDVVIRSADGWRYKSKRVIYDTSRVQTLLATPI